MDLDDLIRHGAMIIISAGDLRQLLEDEMQKTEGEQESSEHTSVPPKLKELLEKTTLSFNTRNRALESLYSSDIRTIGQLVRLSRSDVLKCRNIGVSKLRTIEETLEEMGLELGMNLDDYDYEDNTANGR